MFTKYVSFTLVVLIFNLACGAVVLGQKTSQDKAAEKAAKKAEKLKVQVAKLGTGKDAKIKVKLTNGQVVRGYVSQINENSFVIVTESSGSATEIQYTDATKFDREPFKFKRWHGLLISAGVIIGVAAILCGGVCAD